MSDITAWTATIVKGPIPANRLNAGCGIPDPDTDPGYDFRPLGAWTEDRCPFFAWHKPPFYCNYCGTCEHSPEFSCRNDDGQHFGQYPFVIERRRLILGLSPHSDCWDHPNWLCVVCYPERSTPDDAIYDEGDLWRDSPPSWRQKAASVLRTIRS